MSVLATMQEVVFICETAARRSSCKSLSQSHELGSHDWITRPAWYSSFSWLLYTHWDRYEALEDSSVTVTLNLNHRSLNIHTSNPFRLFSGLKWGSSVQSTIVCILQMILTLTSKQTTILRVVITETNNFQTISSKILLKDLKFYWIVPIILKQLEASNPNILPTFD